MKIYYIDIDETICQTPGSRHYSDAIPIQENIDKMNRLYDAGNTIVYWTSRGSRKQIDWHEFTRAQLISWGVKFHELRTDKPYYDIFIDDKTKRIEEI
jgi:histidinol phosphatase-like enzyme